MVPGIAQPSAVARQPGCLPQLKSNLQGAQFNRRSPATRDCDLPKPKVSTIVAWLMPAAPAQILAC